MLQNIIKLMKECFWCFLRMLMSMGLVAVLFIVSMYRHMCTKAQKRRKEEAAKLVSLNKAAVENIKQKCDEGFVESRSFSSSSGVSLHYVIAGPKDGELIVLLHGFPECWYTWHRIIPSLANLGYVVVALDMRGYGQSGHPEGMANYTKTKLVQDVVDLVHNEMKYESAHIVAHDWGAAVAWQLARTHPKVVEKLVIMNVPHPDTWLPVVLRNPHQLFKSWYVIAFQIPKVFEWMCEVVPFLSSNKFYTDQDKKLMRAAHARGIGGMLNYYRAYFGMPLWTRLRLMGAPKEKEFPLQKVVEQPVLIIWGTDDEALVEGFADALTGSHHFLVPDLRLVKLAGCSHWVPIERPDEVVTQVKAFLAEK